jgi:hypothetical protein
MDRLPKELSGIATAQLQSSSAVLETTNSFLKDCPSELYYIILQPSLASSDLSSPDSIPNLRRALKNPGVHSRYSVAEVLRSKDVSIQDLVKEIDSQCGGVLGFDDATGDSWKGALNEGKRVVVTTTFDALPAVEDERRKMLADNGKPFSNSFPISLLKQARMIADQNIIDAKLHTPLTDLVSGYRYTVIYTSTPPSSLIQSSTSSSTEVPLYEAEFQNLEHLDLKRNLKMREDNTSLNDTAMLPLFEKYQFLTPGTYTRGLISLFSH